LIWSAAAGRPTAVTPHPGQLRASLTPAENNLGSASTVNGGTLFVQQQHRWHLQQRDGSKASPSTTGGTLSDDTTVYDSYLSQSKPAGASFVSANTTTINLGGNLTVINGAQLLTGHLALNTGAAIINANLPGTGGTVSSTPLIDTRQQR